MRKTPENLRTLAWVLDDSLPIPGTKYRIGLDALVGLVPGVGDLLGTVLSSYIVLQAAQLGVSKATLVRMVINIAIEGVLGSVPFAGDVFDAAWKANQKNVVLLDRELATGRPVHTSKLFIAGVAVALVVIVLVVCALAYFFVRGLMEVLGNLQLP